MVRRAWIMDELRRKNWDDLHSLWWNCVEERNRIATSSAERDRLQAGFGLKEAQERASTVRKTQQAIKQTLRERWYAWRDAVDLAKNEPSINLEPNKENPAYNLEKDEYKMVREEQEMKIAEGQSQQYLQ
ncbi:MAG: 54S ribosomal protein L4 mitochondrial [Alyxoria varia]|nr:MAG: 54S ribosomal protein L4 mitochondrial [Alyxoria varia]